MVVAVMVTLYYGCWPNGGTSFFGGSGAARTPSRWTTSLITIQSHAGFGAGGGRWISHIHVKVPEEKMAL
jgi:hypothetical protein